MATNKTVISIEVDTSQALAEIDRLKKHMESVPPFEFDEIQELTYDVPVWLLFAAAFGGGAATVIILGILVLVFG